MSTEQAIQVIVLGEGKDEQGESFLRPGIPGSPIPSGDLGALHVLVQRVLQEYFGLQAIMVWPPRLRSGRRPGNPGLLRDLEGQPRENGKRRAGPWLELCRGINAADLAIVVKDACFPGREDATSEAIRNIIGDPPISVVAAAATPSLEGWLIPVDESEGLDEKQAKERWTREIGGRGVPKKVERAGKIELSLLRRCSPGGFDVLVRDIETWVRGR